MSATTHRRKCATCNGTGTVECLVVKEIQLGDEVPYDSTIGRFYGDDPDHAPGLKRRQRVEMGLWDCEDCVDGWAIADEDEVAASAELTEATA